MKTKQLIAIILALLVAAALLAGCEASVGDLGATTAPSLDPAAMARLMSELGLGDDLDALTPEQRADLQRGMWDNGLDTGVTIPPPSSSMVPATAPPTLPPGVSVQSSEVYHLVKAVQDTFNSGTFYLKARGTFPVEMGSGGYAPIIIAMDQDKLMFETEMDWVSLMKANAAPGEKAMAAMTGASMQTMFGNKFRMVISPEGAYWVFPASQRYFDLSAMAGPEGLGDMSGLAEAFNIFRQEDANGQPLQVPDDIPSTKVTVDGKEYLCGAFVARDEEGKVISTMRYYFLNGQIKRIEVVVEGMEENMVLEIDEFSGRVDASLFSVTGYRTIPLTELAGIASFMGGGSAPVPTTAP